jgi:hypothetical protein
LCSFDSFLFPWRPLDKNVFPVSSISSFMSEFIFLWSHFFCLSSEAIIASTRKPKHTFILWVCFSICTWEEVIACYKDIFCYYLFFFCNTGVWAQGLHLEPLDTPFFVLVFFQDRVTWTISPGWFRTSVLLVSASWVARITSKSY